MNTSVNDTSHWTGGHYALARTAIGGYTALRLALLVCRDAPVAVTAIELVGMVAAFGFGIGLRERVTGLIAATALVLLASRSGFLADPGLYATVPLLLIPWLLAEAPFGGISARGRVDPRGSWTFPQRLDTAVLSALAALLIGAGIATLLREQGANPSDQRIAAAGIAAAVLVGASLVNRTLAPFAWLGIALVLVTAAIPPGLGPIQPPMLLASLLAWRPAWVPTLRGGQDLLLYDGHCGLCHGVVRFILAEEREPHLMRIAPLQSAAASASLTDEQLASLPESSVVITEDGNILVRAQAVGRILQRLGGIWRIVGIAIGVVPARLADRCYDLIASNRSRVFGTRDEACPMLPPELRSRIEA